MFWLVCLVCVLGFCCLFVLVLCFLFGLPLTILRSFSCLPEQTTVGAVMACTAKGGKKKQFSVGYPLDFLKGQHSRSLWGRSQLRSGTAAALPPAVSLG